MLRFVAATLVMFLLSSCSYQPKIADAYVHKNAGEYSTVVVRIKKSVAVNIRDKELYFSMVVVNCQDRANRFPVEPYISGRPATEFKYKVSGEYIDFTGSIPTRILCKYSHPCVFLEGGSYMSGKIKSDIALLVNK
jgi:hypothetical protein